LKNEGKERMVGNIFSRVIWCMETLKATLKGVGRVTIFAAELHYNLLPWIFSKTNPS